MKRKVKTDRERQKEIEKLRLKFIDEIQRTILNGDHSVECELWESSENDHCTCAYDYALDIRQALSDCARPRSRAPADTR